MRILRMMLNESLFFRYRRFGSRRGAAWKVVTPGEESRKIAGGPGESTGAKDVADRHVRSAYAGSRPTLAPFAEELSNR